MKRKNAISMALAAAMLTAAILPGCGADENSGKTEIEILQYKPEAAAYFDKVEEEFNASHDDIHLTISSPNDASTIMRTRFVREDYPDIIGIGGDINYSYYVDADILADVSDYPGLADIKESYVDILEALEITPTDGTYGVPYVANAAGILYNKDMFEEHGWEIPETWSELIDLCEEIRSEGILPFYFGFRDTWTCLAPWNSLAVDLAPADTCKQVNAGETTFTDEYRETAEKCLELLEMGVNVGFDTVGKLNYCPDIFRVQALQKIAERGRLSQVVLSMDITRKSHLKAFGGIGYGYLFESFLPLLRENGFSEEQIAMLLIHNPRRILEREEEEA